MFGSGSTLFIAKMADLHGQQNTCEPQVCFSFKALTRWWRHLTDTVFLERLPKRTRRLCKYYTWLHCAIRVVSSFLAALIVVQTHFLHSCNSWNDAGHVASLELGPGQWVFLPCHFSFSRVKPAGNFACVLK